ncbi:polyketide cyclase [Herbaspirillum sp. LeCh32-8]|uniref:SRPBCC family protein n=1 Tax=Herbaspirillum sp. LeCh32-8 TaxID=2821356 RepID=UPI001AE509B6|nr:SRPBCC family protein [Herbaspirillum sp. LeCh32-8]MBP0599040.1 polyketide cyclase [Herbaspirillum sp. LeCh32-8]
MTTRQAVPHPLPLRRALSLLCAVLATLLPAVAAAQTPPLVSVNTNRVDGRAEFDVRAEAYARTDIARAWKVLTAYDRLAEFVPNLQSSRELPFPDAAPNEHLVEQHGYGKFLFIRQPIDLVLRVQEQPSSAIDMSLQSGNMRKYHARWELEPRDVAGGPGVLLRYTGLIAPDFYVPGLFGGVLMRRDLTAMLEAVVREMEKPADAAPPPLQSEK